MTSLFANFLIKPLSSCWFQLRGRLRTREGKLGPRNITSRFIGGVRMSRLLQLLILVFAFLVGAVAGGYWGEHYSHTAIVLRRTRQIIFPSAPP